MDVYPNQFSYRVFNADGVPIGEATVLASGAMQVNIPPTLAARQMTTRLVMNESHKIVMIDTKEKN